MSRTNDRMTKNDPMDAMIMLSAHVLAEENASRLMGDSSHDATIPPSADRRIRRMINRERRKAEYGTIISAAKRVAAVILVVCTAAFALAMSVKAVREALWSTIVEWFDEYISVAYVVDSSPPATIEAKMEPTAIPEDWVREVKLDSQSMYIVSYTKDGGIVMDYSQTILDGSDTLFDNSNTTVEPVEVGGEKGDLITLHDKGRCYLVWNDGRYSYMIGYEITGLDYETVLTIAESIE